MVDYSYNSKLDILVVDREDREPEAYSHTVTVGDYNIDLDNEGRFLGLELLNATQNLPYSKKELEDIQDVDLEVNEYSESSNLNIQIRYEGQKGAISLGYKTKAQA